MGSVGDFERKLKPEFHPFKKFFLSARSVVKTVLRYEASVHVVRDRNGDIDFAETTKLAVKKLTAELSHIPNLALTIEKTEQEGKLLVTVANDEVLTVMLPMWIADP